MANPILAALNRPNEQSQPSNSNPLTPAPPQQQNSPSIETLRQGAMSTLQQYGGDGQKAFFAECQKKGIDPNYALKQAQIMFNQAFGGNKR